MNTPDPGYRPPGAPVNEPPGDDRGSLLTGFLLGWAVLVASWVLVGMLWAVLASSHALDKDWATPFISLTALTPFLATIGLLLWFAAKGKPRSAAGVALTFASLVALAVLLVAACFGLFATSSFR
jgi:hypothetical protein